MRAGTLVARSSAFARTGLNGRGGGVIAWTIGAFLVLVGGAFTCFVLTPSIGIDDANITQVYAASFAQHFEFTYYPGGERVEGSTSLLWTLLNAFLFSIPGPAELYVTLMCALLTVITIANCWTLGRMTFLPSDASAFPLYSVIFGGLFLAVPSFFAWSIWTLMDITIWLALLSAILVQTTRQLQPEATPLSSMGLAIFSICFAFLTITRPEGIAISIGILLFLVAQSSVEKRSELRFQYLIAFAVTLAVFAAATVWRVSYFGVPFPNTFYAKVSGNTMDQAMSGLTYFQTFLMSDFNALLLILVGVGAYLGRIFGRSILEWVFDHRLFLLYFMVGIFALYAVLGGDHFGSYRFYQPAFLVIVPWIAGSIAFAVSRAEPDRRRFGAMAATLALILAISISWIGFGQSRGGLDREFRIAENGRLLGARLNKLDTETSIAIIPAGGTAITYNKGPIFDLMGLNWTTMAHASDDLSGTFKNHGGFVESVFWQAAPDVVIPENVDCSNPENYPDAFWHFVLKGMLDSERFQMEYEEICVNSVAMFVKRSRVEQVTAAMTGADDV